MEQQAEEQQAEEQQAKRQWSKKELWVGGLAIIITIGFCAAAIYYKDALMSTDYLARFGLLGVLIVAFIAGSTFSVTAIPVPYWLLVFTLPGIVAEEWGILAPVWVGLLAGLGASLGQFITFMIGYGGRSLSKRVTSKFSSNFYNEAISWAERHGSLAVFVMSAVFNPLHLPMTIAIAALGYPPHKFFFFCFLGSALKSLVIAFCGYYGLTSLFSWLGV
jgi:membrane protein DedA with SNARE-associated domain